jgi:AraC-like DNA-binding protein
MRNLQPLPPSPTRGRSPRRTDHTESLGAVSILTLGLSLGVGFRLLQLKLGLPWRAYLLQARMLRAMALLASPTQSVQENSTAVGFDSLSSFSRAFTQFCGETPSSYRKRVAGRTGLTGLGRTQESAQSLPGWRKTPSRRSELTLASHRCN